MKHRKPSGPSSTKKSHSSPRHKQQSNKHKHTGHTKSHTSTRASHAGKERIRGTVWTTGKGTGFVEIPGQAKDAEDILIEPQNLNHALNGDEVEIVLLPLIKGERQGGEVVNILKRAKTSFVGTVKQGTGFSFVVPDDKKMYTDIFVPRSDTEVMDGQKVLVKINSWEPTERAPLGKIVQVLGKKGEHEVEIQSIILERGIETDFPEDVLREAQEIEQREKPLPIAEIKSRRDMRQTTTFTIDPITAKDFDDAISFKKLPDGDVEIGVHIADVSHYVVEGTKLDLEARKRAFSVYLVDRTIPMLPEVLSNDLCSLNPHEDKFAFSAVFKVNRRGDVKERWFGKTIINSNRRFSYEDAQEVINTKSGDYVEELTTLNDMAKIMRADRMKNGAIDFEQDEVRFELDARGTPIRVYKKEHLDTHKLVEENMLLANREVAEFIYNAHLKGVKGGIGMYRIHDVPDRDRIAQLSLFLKALGYDLHEHKGQVDATQINSLLKQAEGKPEEALIKTATIRSMAKAIYSTKNIGHFGLAFKYYTHFTSPIRRYPDLMVHRILENELSGKRKRAQNEYALYERIAADSTQREIAAAEAERASIKLKQVEFMSTKVGQTFDGTVSGVTEWGIYIEEAETRAEGMIRLRDLTDDYYELDPKTYSIKGTKSGRKFTLGDKVKVKLLRADLDAKTLDFQFA